MFPKQLEGSLVSSKENSLVAHPTVETVGAGLVQEGGAPLDPDRGLKGAKALTRCT